MQLETVGIDELTEHPKNPRSHPPDQLAHLEASLADYGWARNVVIARDGVILAGHGIVQAARRRGETTVPVHRLDLASDDPKAEKFMVLENAVSRLAVDDDAQLAALLADVQRTEGLEGTGYDETDLRDLLEGMTGGGAEGALSEALYEQENPLAFEVGECCDYIVLVFRRSVNFQHACTVFNVREASDGGGKKGGADIGIGRVIDGDAWVAKHE